MGKERGVKILRSRVSLCHFLRKHRVILERRLTFLDQSFKQIWWYTKKSWQYSCEDSLRFLIKATLTFIEKVLKNAFETVVQTKISCTEVFLIISQNLLEKIGASFIMKLQA